MERANVGVVGGSARPRMAHRWVLVLFSVLLFAPAMGLGIGDHARLMIVQLAAFILLAGWLTQAKWRLPAIKSLIGSGPNLPLVLFAGWAVLSFATTTSTGRAGSVGFC